MQATRHVFRAVLLVAPRVVLVRHDAACGHAGWREQCLLRLAAAGGRHARRNVHAAAAAAVDSEAVLLAPPEQRAGKRKVALFIGYEGTEYRGLQMQRESVPDETVEDVLEEAIFRAGGILESNRGELSKVSWSRSSRTDKSVHSLTTVVGMKMEVKPAAFEADPEGQQLAGVINSYLPPEVRVFSIQRVNKSWNARSECIRRSYRYYVPASALGLALDGGEADAERLALLRRAWESFQGNHPFHNYTKRRLYREVGFSQRGRGWRGDVRTSGNGSELEGEESEEEVQATRLGKSTSSSSDIGIKWQVQVAWKSERDNADPIVRRHFRFIEWCQADTEAKPLVPGGQPCIMLSLLGNSFMLHQIRHMVGMAVAVARSSLPLELLEASLATPARVNTPMAPPSTLMLMGAQFSPFKRSWSGQAAVAAQWTGEVLQLKEQGTAVQQAFLQEHMLPALDTLLAGEEWRQWEHALEQLWYDEPEVQQLLATHAAWREQRQAAKQERLLEEAAGWEAHEES